MPFMLQHNLSTVYHLLPVCMLKPSKCVSSSCKAVCVYSGHKARPALAVVCGGFSSSLQATAVEVCLNVLLVYLTTFARRHCLLSVE
jgi:hypothetical protein